MVSVTLQRMLNIAYSNCLNYSYYSDFRDEYLFCLRAAFFKIDSFFFLVIICMALHWHISSYKLFMFLMLRTVNWQVIRNLDHVLFFLPLDWISITCLEAEERTSNIKSMQDYLCGNIATSLVWIPIPQTFVWTKTTCLYVSIKQIVGWHEHRWKKCSELRWVLTDPVVYPVPVMVQLIGDGERT